LFENGNELGRVRLTAGHHPLLWATGGHTGQTSLDIGAAVVVVVSTHSTSTCSGARGWCAAVGIDAFASSLTSNTVKCGIARSIHGFIHLPKHALIPSTSLSAVSH
jgi:hypothetical protein